MTLIFDHLNQNQSQRVCPKIIMLTKFCDLGSIVFDYPQARDVLEDNIFEPKAKAEANGLQG